MGKAVYQENPNMFKRVPGKQGIGQGGGKERNLTIKCVSVPKRGC